ncbi:MAG TPA: cation diffusion facilitator family transporter [Noviherbaspirillum sp.]|jgi:cobalt-zinc-cadmium efflux system protein|uniref:cation diffusion facilitator family transporter n=1 Tax=Noviherbaspirillum sp. TaxID=1926288 RepID=UPI002F934574
MPHDHHSIGSLHAHRHGDATHRHVIEGRNPRVLLFSVLLTLAFAAVEAIAGYWSNSLALISDAGHMLTDSTALGLALLAQHIARRPPSPRHSFGFGRAEALAAFINALAMLALVAWIAYEALHRFSAPQVVAGEAVFIVALIGMTVNLLVAWLLSHDKGNVNTRAALVHVLGDLLGSIAALCAGAIIYFTGWYPVDPLLSIGVSLLILRSTLAVLKDAYHFLMEGVPRNVDYLQVGADLAAIDGVNSVHDLHVWEMTPGQPALIGHVEIRSLEEWPWVLARIKAMLLEKHRIDHITLQPELPSMAQEP